MTELASVDAPVTQRLDFALALRRAMLPAIGSALLVLLGNVSLWVLGSLAMTFHAGMLAVRAGGSLATAGMAGAFGWLPGLLLLAFTEALLAPGSYAADDLPRAALWAVACAAGGGLSGAWGGWSGRLPGPRIASVGLHLSQITLLVALALLGLHMAVWPEGWDAPAPVIRSLAVVLLLVPVGSLASVGLGALVLRARLDPLERRRALGRAIAGIAFGLAALAAFGFIWIHTSMG